MKRWAACLVVSTATVMAALPRTAWACAIAPAEGQRVAMAREEAVIVWDEEKRIEHFVRRADFDTSAPDFGFLVPTPTRPELAEASDEVFRRLEEVIRPRVERYDVQDITVGCWTLLPLSRSAAEAEAVAVPPAVRVLETTRVAGLDATVLEADDAAALGDWLKKNGYPSRPALVEWVKPYVEGRWKVTAFKIAAASQDAGSKPAGEPGAIGSRAVRMSFATERPFFPYREPSDAASEAGRSLRVFLVGPARMLASSGAAEWGAKVEYAATSKAVRSLLEGALPSAAVAPEAWLTTFLDTSTTRAPEDLYFTPSPGAAPVIPPPIVIRHREQSVLPLEALVLLVPPAYWLWRRRRRRRAEPRAAGARV